MKINTGTLHFYCGSRHVFKNSTGSLELRRVPKGLCRRVSSFALWSCRVESWPGSGSEINNSISESGSCKLFRIRPDPDPQHWCLRYIQYFTELTAIQLFSLFQSSDGQPIFLHALNVQMLVAEYGSLQNCPTVIRYGTVPIHQSLLGLSQLEITPGPIPTF